jgi:hypothetical protein
LNTEELVQIDGWIWIGCSVCSKRLGYFKENLKYEAVCSPECAEAWKEAHPIICMICKKSLKNTLARHGDICHDCTYHDPLFWCYKYNHFSHNREPCKQCLSEKETEKRTPI